MTSKPSTESATSIPEAVILRMIELCVALCVTVLLFTPLLLARIAVRVVRGTPVFSEKTICGHSGKPLTVLNFADLSGHWAGLPLFLELFTGRLALAGLSIREWTPGSEKTAPVLCDTVKPGIISLWEIRKSSKIAHEGREATDREYLSNKGLSYDILLMLRALPALFFSEPATASSAVFRLFDLNLDNITMRDAIEMIREKLRQKQQSVFFFVNPDCMNISVTNPDYRKALGSANYILPDGIGLVIAGKILGTPLRENINGTDMLPWLCAMAVEEQQSIYLLGGKPGIAEKAAAALSNTFGVHIAGTGHGYFNRETESSEVVKRINESKASILLVAFGAPLQEQWIARHRRELHPSILMGVGGLFDFYSGNIRRAPRWIREIGFEWVYRLMQEPSRMWKRYIVGNPLFLFRVLRWKLFG